MHGEAYGGHVFWDEVFVYPLLTLRRPALSRSLLGYRHRRLPQAQRAATAEGLDGALFQTTGDADYLAEQGADLIVGVARLFASLAEWDNARARYSIHGVMARPDPEAGEGLAVTPEELQRWAHIAAHLRTGDKRRAAALARAPRPRLTGLRVPGPPFSPSRALRSPTSPHPTAGSHR
ncbi:hypothetical protein [Leifsonia sp. P73]|uniref:hypothetical protein n=1 Tax=Leifsonia sp. P73 TaxID=3423959 RepID=UPI003DA221D9